MVAIFWLAAGLVFFNRDTRREMLARPFSIWILDIVGLTIHGVLVPVFQYYIIFKSMDYLVPEYRSSIVIHPTIGFLFSFVFIDYLYYWNHRILHTGFFWRFHHLHHSGESFDVFTTSRNSAITTLLIVYIWMNGACIFLIQDRGGFALGVLLSNLLDLWRHSRIGFWGRFFPFSIFCSPSDHSWHHSRDVYGRNFGGNFIIWDKIHGTFYANRELPKKFGLALPTETIWRSFWKGMP